MSESREYKNFKLILNDYKELEEHLAGGTSIGMFSQVMSWYERLMGAIKRFDKKDLRNANLSPEELKVWDNIMWKVGLGAHRNMMQRSKHLQRKPIEERKK